MVVGFVGSGNMAAAMARGWAAGPGGPERLLFTDSGSGRAAALADELDGGAVSNAELAETADLVVLAVKPARLADAAAELGGARAVVSLLGATSLDAVAAAMPGAAVFRVMPNVAVEARRGVLCFAAAADVDAALAERVRGLMAVLGRVVALADSDFDAATAVMGCSPAYLALAAGAIADAGAAAGLDRDLARELVAETAIGTGDLLRRRSAAEICRAVASPGGSTEAGLEALGERRAEEAFAAAVEASLKRMRG